MTERPQAKSVETSILVESRNATKVLSIEDVKREISKAPQQPATVDTK